MIGSAASAATVTSIVGDNDGFGGQIAPGAVGADTGFSFDNRTGTDPLFTDIWLFEQDGGIGGSPITYDHSYDLDGGIATSASLTIFESGMANDRGPWEVLVNGTVVGQIANGGSTTAALHTFDVDVSLLTGSIASITLNYLDTAFEGYAIDYSELSIEVAPVPLPAGLPLLLVGLLGLGALRSRRKA